MLADFIITIEKARKPLAVQVKVHNSTAALRRAATRYDNQIPRSRGTKPPDFSDLLGICHRMHWDNQPISAIVRLAPPYLGAGIVAHELGHAAIWLWEIQNKFDETGLTCQNDEWFCWVLGELVRQTTIQLINKGIY